MTEEQVFLAVLDMENPADRSAYLDKVCGQDTRFRRLVDELLDAHLNSGDFLNEPVGKQMGAVSVNEKKPEEEANELFFLQRSTRPDSLGRIGHYEVLQILGKGGFGIVFRAFDDVLQREVALKVLSPVLAATSPARKRFLREARSSAQVRHENVVQIYAVEEQPLPYLVMEFIPGETLQQRLDRTGPLELLEIVRLGRQIAEGLSAAHGGDLIHRDIKPGNVLIEAGGQERVKITDFGLARAADDASLTQSGVLAGTPMYMAPEQAQGATLDHRADLFSLGSVLYVMATGRPPFRAASTYAVLKRVVEDDPRPIRESIPELPQWLSDVIAKLHAKMPDARFPSAREVADLLADCEAQLKANPTLTNLSRIPQRNSAVWKAGWWMAIATAAVLLPVLALVLSEVFGFTHFRQTQQPTMEQGNNSTPAQELPPDHTNTIGMQFKLIPTGTFTMGSSANEIDYWFNRVEHEGQRLYLQSEAPAHEVEITKPFYLGTTEVTVGQFRQFIDANPKYTLDSDRWKNPGWVQADEYPVVWVMWRDAVAFCEWLSKKEGRTYRLPTEAEWEYACRAGTKTRYSFGDDEAQLEDYAWIYKIGRVGTRQTATKKPNPWGLYDMHGNAWEWCQDYHDLRYYETSPRKDPTGPLNGNSYIKRGGSWGFGAVDSRCAFRSHLGGGMDGGFRVLLVAQKKD